ncbi:MAG: hypothetical protein WDA24_05265 [Tissierellales bacterium]
MTKKVCCMMSLFMVIAMMLTGCGAVLTDASNLTQYELGDDLIPSITSVVGERKVTGVESSIENGVVTKQYTYSSTSVYDDLWTYVQELMNDGWLVTQDIDLNVIPGSGQLGKGSIEEGQILLVSFSYEESSYTIKLVKGKGTIE